MNKMYIPNTSHWINYYENLGKHGNNPYLKHKTGKQIGGGSLTGSPRSFMTSIGPAVRPPSEEKVTVQLVSPVQQTEEMARDLVQRENVKKGIKRKSSISNFSSTKRRRIGNTKKNSRKTKNSGRKKINKKHINKKRSRAPLKKEKKSIKKKSVKKLKDIFG